LRRNQHLEYQQHKTSNEWGITHQAGHAVEASLRRTQNRNMQKDTLRAIGNDKIQIQQDVLGCLTETEETAPVNRGADAVNQQQGRG
jgi:hypothetical protein